VVQESARGETPRVREESSKSFNQARGLSFPPMPSTFPPVGQTVGFRFGGVSEMARQIDLL
jgi:hypothetical protein